MGPSVLDLPIVPISVQETIEIKATPAISDEIKYRRLGSASVEAFLIPAPDALLLVAPPAFGLIAAAVNNSQREIVNILLPFPGVPQSALTEAHKRTSPRLCRLGGHKDEI